MADNPLLQMGNEYLGLSLNDDCSGAFRDAHDGILFFVISSHVEMMKIR